MNIEREEIMHTISPRKAVLYLDFYEGRLATCLFNDVIKIFLRDPFYNYFFKIDVFHILSLSLLSSSVIFIGLESLGLISFTKRMDTK